MSLRERTRRAVRTELIEVAQMLILERGYDQVTIEQITDAAGISQRSFFRYFSSKEALVVDKFDPFGEELLRALDARPTGEPVWTSLQHVFDPMADWMDQHDNAATAAAMTNVIAANPTLQAGYLLKLARIQHQVLVRLQRSARADGWNDLVLHATVGAAFACFVAAFEVRHESADRFRRALRTGMDALRPGADLQSSTRSYSQDREDRGSASSV